jgi:hypothetical protein
MPGQNVQDELDVLGAVREALGGIKLNTEDLGASGLALRLAYEIDNMGDVRGGSRTLAELGRALLATLESLGMTPQARKGIKVPEGVTPSGPVVDPREAAKDELRARRRMAGPR